MDTLVSLRASEVRFLTQIYILQGEVTMKNDYQREVTQELIYGFILFFICLN